MWWLKLVPRIILTMVSGPKRPVILLTNGSLTVLSALVPREEAPSGWYYMLLEECGDVRKVPHWDVRPAWEYRFLVWPVLAGKAFPPAWAATSSDSIAKIEETLSEEFSGYAVTGIDGEHLREVVF